MVRGSADAFRNLMGGGVEAAREATDASSSAIQGAVENTVATAYALSDQLMNRGYWAAGLYSRSTGGPTMSSNPYRGEGRYPPDARPGGGPPGSESGADPWGSRALWGFWTEPWMQLMRMWTDSLYMLSSSANPMNPMNPLASAMGVGGNPGVSIEVQSARPVRVTLDLAPRSDFETLSVGPLVLASDPSSDTLDEVSVSARPGQYSVHVQVSDQHAPGLYIGSVESAPRRVLGELRVEIIGAAKKPAAKKKAARKKAARAPAKKKA
jgi:hypothetical protein